jgi:acetyl esterase/lipase
MVWTVRGWKHRALAGLVLVVAVVGVAGAIWLRVRTIEGQDVEYGEAGGKPLRLDIYKPVGPATARPGVFLIHGGGWAEGDKSSERGMAEGLTKAGFVAIAVGYRLAKDNASRYPAQVDDVRRAVRWVRAHAVEIGVDPERLGAFGTSAGGHLAAILGTTEARGTGDWRLKDHSSRVQCVVDLCGPTDFTDESSPPVGPVIAWMVPNLFGKTRLEAPDAYRDASPVSHVDGKSAPTLIFHGTADDIVPIDQSRRFRVALDKAGVEVKLVELEGEGHQFQQPENQARMIQETMAFLRRHLKP